MEGEREGEKHRCIGFLSHAYNQDLAYNPRMFPNQESNQRPFGPRDDA